MQSLTIALWGSGMLSELKNGRMSVVLLVCSGALIA
uniref:Uncharacterized protein n=1 Tax=Anguilla anguilla TaxID=7936 RepID=A0A0E9T0K7_ANGAN